MLQDVSTDVPIGPKVHFSLHEVLGCAEVHTMKEIIDSYSLNCIHVNLICVSLSAHSAFTVYAKGKLGKS